VFPALDDPDAALYKQRAALAWIFQEEPNQALSRLQRYLQHAEGYLRDEAKAICGLMESVTD
jgi:hypothetical protein